MIRLGKKLKMDFIVWSITNGLLSILSGAVLLTVTNYVSVTHPNDTCWSQCSSFTTGCWRRCCTDLMKIEEPVPRKASTARQGSLYHEMGTMCHVRAPPHPLTPSPQCHPLTPTHDSHPHVTAAPLEPQVTAVARPKIWQPKRSPRSLALPFFPPLV